MIPAGKNVVELIFNTSMVQIIKLVPEGSAEIWAKIEGENPGGSVKDRIGLNMILDAEEKGLVDQETLVVEPTSGNTGIGLAMVCAARGYPLILTMPETMSQERKSLLKAFGAQLVLTPGIKGMKGAIEKAQELATQEKKVFMPQQFKNPANPDVHRTTTAPEIIKALNGVPDAFVAGVGTGGTITGVGEVFKQKSPQVKIVAVEPSESPVLSGGKPGPHRIQGIGAGFVPDILNRKVIDEVLTVSYEESKATAQELAKVEGLLMGVSSGGALHAALRVAKELGIGKKVATVFASNGERYLSTGLFES